MLQKSYITIIIKGWIRDRKVLFHNKSKIEVIKQDYKRDSRISAVNDMLFPTTRLTGLSVTN